MSGRETWRKLPKVRSPHISALRQSSIHSFLAVAVLWPRLSGPADLEKMLGAGKAENWRRGLNLGESAATASRSVQDAGEGSDGRFSRRNRS
jgi:hypothetical protein